MNLNCPTYDAYSRLLSVANSDLGPNRSTHTDDTHRLLSERDQLVRSEETRIGLINLKHAAEGGERETPMTKKRFAVERCKLSGYSTLELADLIEYIESLVAALSCLLCSCRGEIDPLADFLEAMSLDLNSMLLALGRIGQRLVVELAKRATQKAYRWRNLTDYGSMVQ